MECQRDDVVEDEVGVLQRDFPASQQDDEMLDGREVLAVLQPDAEGESLRLSRSSEDEILEENIWLSQVVVVVSVLLAEVEQNTGSSQSGMSYLCVGPDGPQ